MFGASPGFVKEVIWHPHMLPAFALAGRFQAKAVDKKVTPNLIPITVKKCIKQHYILYNTQEMNILASVDISGKMHECHLTSLAYRK